MVTANKFIYDLFMHKKALELCFSILDLEYVNAVHFCIEEETGKGNVNVSISVCANDFQIQITQLSIYDWVEKFNLEAKLHRAWETTEEAREEGEITAKLSVSYDGNYTTNPDNVSKLGKGISTFLLLKERDISPKQVKARARKIAKNKWHDYKCQGGVAAGGVH